MPELPEVETIRRGLEAALCGSTIERVVVSGSRSIRRQDPEEFIETMTGRTLTGFFRHGKFLWFALDDGRVMVVHLRMSGRLRLVEKGAPAIAHTHVLFGLTDGRELHFVDPRTFGECFVSTIERGATRPDALVHLGPDATDPDVGAVLDRVLGETGRAVKVVLLDQNVIAGLGNIYADEACARARIRPDRSARSLSQKERSAVIESVAEVVAQATKGRGSSLRDVSYRDLFDQPGEYQDRHAVYQRTGVPCRTCQTPIERVVLGGRSAHFCPRCQT